MSELFAKFSLQLLLVREFFYVCCSCLFFCLKSIFSNFHTKLQKSCVWVHLLSQPAALTKPGVDRISEKSEVRKTITVIKGVNTVTF